VADADEILASLREALLGANDEPALYEVQVRFLGRKGLVTELSKSLGKLAPGERKAAGERINALKRTCEEQLEARRAELGRAARARELARTDDLTFVPARLPVGTLHVVTRTRRTLDRIFRNMGFDVVDGPHVEHARYNFDDLNVGVDHPARDMADTFFVRPREGDGVAPGDLVLRTHTSPLQIRSMLTRPPPLRVVCLGAVFRRDDDATHTPQFHQIEGLCIDRGVGMADLKATLLRFTQELFGPGMRVRLRPSYFPFVEPGAEFDMSCPFCTGGPCQTCKGSRWIELGGSGMVHPSVLEAVDYDPEAWTGWAFGFGIDRMAMLIHGIHDLRLMWEGDVRFLEQFTC
jgi:phenylalanyl-tRNA synthetase alpha chain